MPLSASGFRPYVRTSESQIEKDKELTPGQWTVFTALIDGLASSAAISTYFEGLISDIVVQRTTQPYGTGWLIPNTLLLEDRIFDGLIIDTVAGNDDLIGLSRVLFHELVHALHGDGGTGRPAGYAYSIEERAAFLENALYRPVFGGPERMGHSQGATGASASAVSYLNGFNLTQEVDHVGSSRFTFTKGAETITKDYRPYGTQVVGEDTYYYDHYITIAYASSVRIIGDAGNIQSSTMSNILANSVGAGGTNQAAIAKRAALSVSAANMELFSAALDEILPTYRLGQKIAVSLSGERFFDGGLLPTDVYGPADALTTSISTGLAIDASNYTSAVIFGGAGSARAGHGNFTAAWDELRAGDGNDVLLAGSGTARYANVLMGAGGNDVLVGRYRADVLNGGDGDDLLVGGGGKDTFQGGDGFDTVSFATSTEGVTINLNVPSGAAINDSGSMLLDVEALIGSDFDDIFTVPSYTNWTAWNAPFIFGGAGNDTFYGNGKSSDRGPATLSGGEGNDTFYTKGGSILLGGGGNDTFVFELSASNAGQNEVYGGNGDDIFRFSGRSNAIIDSGSGSNIIELTRGGQASADLVNGNSADRIIFNGRVLTGSDKPDPLPMRNPEGFNPNIDSWTGKAGEKYSFSDDGSDLYISAGGSLVIRGFVNGMMGIHLAEDWPPYVESFLI